MKLTNEVINEIRNKTDIVEVISNYLPLTQRGKNYFGVCPFHDDHSPSMSVSKEKQIFTCFSCGATGNVFTFVSDYEHISFIDAVKSLGKKVGYDFGDYQITKNKNADLYEIYDLACKFYQNNLNTNLGTNAKEYLDKRKIDKDSIKKFKIGLSASKASLTDYLLSKQIPLKKLVDLGISNENGTDLFINRIMFPLYDLEGKVIAFSGRIYNTKDSSKYINTKETAIFKKGTILYNYHNAKELLKKNDVIIVMEGFMDVIRANTVGITNCVATMGTALTKQNANLLKKMANNIILCFDGDKAGEEATTSAINVFKELDVIPKIIRLEENLDPDEYILKYGVEAFKNKITNAENPINFLMNLHRTEKNLNDIEDITKYIEESLNDLTNEKDDILIELTLNKLSTEFKIKYDILKEKYQNIKLQKVNESKKNKSENIKTITHNKYNQYDKATRVLIFYMLKDEKIINMVEHQITFIAEPNTRALINEIIYYYHKYKVINIADFISYISNNQEEVNLIKEILTMKLKDMYNNEEIDDYIKVINSYPSKQKIENMTNKLKMEKDPLKQASILKETMLLRGVKEWLKK
mgnify:CR=1 FL=1